MTIQDFIPPVVKQFFGLQQQGASSFMDWAGGYAAENDVYKAYKGIVWKCINVIARATARAEWQIKRPSGSQDQRMEVVANHPWLKLLEKPNPEISKFDLIFGSAAFEEIVGEWFWYFALGESSGLPKEIYLLDPRRVKVVIDKDTSEVLGYKYAPPGKSDIPMELNEILHHKTFNLDTPYRGKGTVQAALDYINIETFTTKFTLNFFKNNATPTGLVMVETSDADEFEKFKRKWKDNYGGVDNAGKTAFLRGSQVKYQKIGLGLNELDMEKLRKLSKDSILEMFGVPRALLGFADDSGLGRATLEVLEYIFAKYNIDDKLKSYDDTMQRAVERFWPGNNLVVEHVSVVPANAEFLLKEEAALVDRVMTRNEVRERRGLKPRKGGDSLFIEARMMEVEGSDTTQERAKAVSSEFGGSQTRAMNVKQNSAPVLITLGEKKKTQ